jgi:hypothetical protein
MGKYNTMVPQLLENGATVLGCDWNPHCLSLITWYLVLNLSVTLCLMCQLLCDDINEERESHCQCVVDNSAFCKSSEDMLIAEMNSIHFY